MKILYVGSEVMPYAAAGGLGDVLGSLPAAVARLEGDKADVRVVMPLHGAIPDEWRQKMDDTPVSPLRIVAGRHSFLCPVKEVYHRDVRFYFIENVELFGRSEIYGYPDDGARYAVFSAAVMELISSLGFFPDILHANDWHSALCCAFLKHVYAGRQGFDGVRSVFTIHNIEYQGSYDPCQLRDYLPSSPGLHQLLSKDGQFNLMRAGILCADAVLTVSPRYSREIKTPQFGCGLEEELLQRENALGGILNGIDYDYYNPENDPVLAEEYSADNIGGKSKCKESLIHDLGLDDDGSPLSAVISRLAAHKGIDLILSAADDMIKKLRLEMVILGKGNPEFEEGFRALEKKYPGRVRTLIEYNRDLSRKIYAAADIFLMPSASEPCGLSQMIASRYGAFPVVRSTGGLYDSIKRYRRVGEKIYGNGFVFSEYSASALYSSVSSAVRLWHDVDAREKLISKIMSIDFSWSVSAKKYMRVYKKLAESVK